MTEGRKAGLTSRRGLMRTGAALSGAVGAGLAMRGVRAADSIDDSLLKRVLDRGKVIVGTGATNPPWHFEDESGKLIGMDVDMAKELAIGLFGIEEDPLANDDEHVRGLVEFVVQEPNARIPNLLTDKVDVVIQFMTVNVNRATQVEFTIPYYREATTFLLPPDAPYSTIAEMQGQGLTIAVLQNVAVEQSTLGQVPDATVDQYPSIADAIAAMDAGRADAAGVDLPVVSGSRRRHLASTSSLTATTRKLRGLGQAWRPDLAELRQLLFPRSNGRNQQRAISGIVQAVVRRGSSVANGRIPARIPLERSPHRRTERSVRRCLLSVERTLTPVPRDCPC